MGIERDHVSNILDEIVVLELGIRSGASSTLGGYTDIYSERGVEV